MKDEIGGKLMITFPALKPKKCGYLTEDNDENKKIKKTKMCQKWKIIFEDNKNYPDATQLKPTKNLMKIALEKIIKFP